MFISEAGLLLSLHISGGRDKKEKKKIPTRDFASVESRHANAPPKPNTNAMDKRITPEPSVFIAKKENEKRKKNTKKGWEREGARWVSPLLS